METELTELSATSYRWLLFFYSVPSKPVSNRMGVWRKLMKSGAIPLKGAVYILPFTPEHYEFLHWLVAEVKGMNGDGALVAIAKVDTIPDAEIVGFFNQARREEYLAVAGDLDAIALKIDNIKKGGQSQNHQGLTGRLDKVGKLLTEIRKIDFFHTPEGLTLAETLDRLQAEVRQLGGAAKKPEQTAVFSQRSAADYHGRVWATRTRPFVDRMASAWLIKRFIDPGATFLLIEEAERGVLPATTVVFDMFGGEFTHVADLCTFEVLIRAFGLKEKALRQMAETVHELDVRDGKYQSPEAQGIEGLLSGIRKTALDDQEALAQGMHLFELFYAAKKS